MRKVCCGPNFGLDPAPWPRPVTIITVLFPSVVLKVLKSGLCISGPVPAVELPAPDSEPASSIQVAVSLVPCTKSQIMNPGMYDVSRISFPEYCIYVPYLGCVLHLSITILPSQVSAYFGMVCEYYSTIVRNVTCFNTANNPHIKRVPPNSNYRGDREAVLVLLSKY